MTDCTNCEDRDAVFGMLCRFCFYARQGGHDNDDGGNGPGVAPNMEREDDRELVPHIAANDPTVPMETPTA